MEDKNGVKIKHRDIVKISEEWFCKPDILLAVKKNMYRDEELEDELVIYNPNCCAICRFNYGYIAGLGVISPTNIEVVGNLDITPELLPLIDFD